VTPPPARVAALLGHGVSEALASRLLASDRLAARVLGVVETRLGELPALDSTQARALAMDADAIAELRLRAGAVWCGNAIAAVVGGPAVRELNAAIGEGLRLLALRGRALAQPVGIASPEAIAAALPGVGAGCLAAWCACQPAPLAARMAMRAPPGTWPAGQAEPAGEAGGAAIVAWLLEQP